MKLLTQFARRCVRVALPVLAGGSALLGAPGLAQQTADTAKPIVVKQKEPKTNLAKFEGTVMHANIAQITVRGKDNELAVRTFPLSQPLSAAMQIVIDRGGFQYGDKVTILYDPVSGVAQKIKGKPSKPV